MADFDSSDYLSSTDNTSYDPNVDTSEDYGSTSDSGSFLDFLSNPSGSFGISDLLKGAKNLFAGTGDFGRPGQLAAFGGLALLLNKMMQQKADPVGYQYGVPRYMVTRTQTPLAQQRPTTTGPDGKVIPYRPGQGGITYFTPMRYQYAGYEPKKAEDFLTIPAGVTPPASPPAGGAVGGGTTGGMTSGGAGSNINFDNPLIDPIPARFHPEGPMAEGIAAAAGGYMPGGIAMLAGGRYLRGPGDGVSDSIPAKFERSGQPARLADGEFVIDARTVSEIGNGSSEAGARKLYAMMDRVHKARKIAKRGKPSGADKYLPK
jgi:hypothetical protein